MLNDSSRQSRCFSWNQIQINKTLKRGQASAPIKMMALRAAVISNNNQMRYSSFLLEEDQNNSCSQDWLCCWRAGEQMTSCLPIAAPCPGPWCGKFYRHIKDSSTTKLHCGHHEMERLGSQQAQGHGREAFLTPVKKHCSKLSQRCPGKPCGDDRYSTGASKCRCWKTNRPAAQRLSRRALARTAPARTPLWSINQIMELL